MFQRTLNTKLAVALLCGFLLLAGVVHLVHGVQVKRTAGALLSQADRDEKAGHGAAAREHLTRYLTLRPKDVQALARYAAMLEGEPGGVVRQVGVYEKILRLEPGKNDVRRKLIDVLMRGEDFTSAKAHLTRLVDSEPRNAELKDLLGQCEEKIGRFSDAEAHYKEAIDLDPGRTQAYARLANLLRDHSGATERADKVMDAREEDGGLIAKNPRSSAAYLARARYRARYKVPDVDPAADVAQALKLAPDDVEALVAAAEMALRGKTHDLEAARGYLERAARLHPDVAPVYHALVRVESASGQVDKAIAWLKRGIDAIPTERKADRAALQWSLADMLILSGQPDSAAPWIAAMREEKVRPEILDFLDASALMARGEWSRAARALAKLYTALALSPDSGKLTLRTLLMLGQAQDRLGNVDQRLDAYRRAVALTTDRDDPLWVTARMGLAASLVSLGKLDEALNLYRIVLPVRLGVGLDIARVQILQNLRRDEGQRHWDAIGKTLDGVEQALAKGELKPGAAAATAVLRSEVLIAQGRYDPARDLLEKALEKQPEQIDLWIALADLESVRGRHEAGLAVLDDAQKRLGDRIELRRARATHWARHGGPEAPAGLASLEQGIEKFSKNDRVALWRQLASANAQAGAVREAERLWKRVAREQPEDLDVLLNSFDMALRAGDTGAANESLAALRRLEGEDGTLWRFARATLLIDDVRRAPKDRVKQLAEARLELEKVARERISWPRVPLAMAEIDEMDGNPEEAIRSYLRAVVDLGDRNPIAVRRLVQLLTERERFAEAQRVITRLREEGIPLSGEMQRLAAQVSFGRRDYGQALEQAERVVSDKSQNYRDLLWLAQIRWAAGGRPEELLRRALALAKDKPETWLALIVYLSANGRRADAEALLPKAEQALPADKATLTLAQGYEAVGQSDRASELYKKALAAHPNDAGTLRLVATFELRQGRRDDAEKHLEQIVGFHRTTADESWARRVLATLLALKRGKGNRQRSLQALEVLGLAGQGGTSAEAASPEDLRTKARILALQPGREKHREARSILEGLVARRAMVPEDLLLLARLDEADGDWPQAHRRLQELLELERDNTSFLALYTRTLLRHGNPDEARVYLGKLERLAPGQPETIELKARLLKAEGKPGEAAATLTTLAAKDTKWIGPVGRVLEELGEAPAAEALYRKTLEQPTTTPGLLLALAGLLARQGRVSEAVDLIERRAWSALPPEVVTNAIVNILYSAGAGDRRLLDRVTDRVERAAKAEPAKIAIQFDLANLRTMQERYDDAEAIYRDVYKRNPGEASALNNLAWMLTLRGGGSAREALSLINQAIDLEGQNPDLLDTRAVVHLAMEQAEPAVRDLEEVIAVSPTAEKYFHLARAYLLAGRPSDAQRAFQEARRRGLDARSLHPQEQKELRQLERLSSDSGG